MHPLKSRPLATLEDHILPALTGAGISIVSKIKTNYWQIGYNLGFRLLSRIPEEVWLQISEYLPQSSFPLISQAIPFFCDVIQLQKIFTKRKIVCYFDKSTFMESSLGFVVTIQILESNVTMKSSFEFVSDVVFEKIHNDKTQNGAKSKFFLPFAICLGHFTKALPILRSSISNLAELTLVPKEIPLNQTDRPVAALKLLVCFMNNIVLSLFKVAEFSSERHVLYAACDEAVRGYTSALHLLLSFVKLYPILVDEIEERVAGFIRFPQHRMKDQTPFIGEFLIYLGLSDVHTWSPEIAKALIPQFLARSVTWIPEEISNIGNPFSQVSRKKISEISDENPYLHLAFIENEPISELRLTDTFCAIIKSLRQLLFHIYFMTMVMKSPKDTKRSSIYRSLEANFGQTFSQLSKATFDASEKIMSIRNFGNFFKLIPGYETITKEGVCRILKLAIRDSEKQ
ncbi:hypothetical protein HK096_006189, partial [Nowakowskiella sp. JEL0078]